MDNETVSCNLHLYSATGTHTFIRNLEMEEDKDFYTYINEGNFTSKGNHAYILYCNTSYYGGFAGGTFEVTSSGHLMSTSESIIYSLFVLILTGLFIFFLIYIHILDSYIKMS